MGELKNGMNYVVRLSAIVLVLERDSFAIADGFGLPGTESWKRIIVKLAEAKISLIEVLVVIAIIALLAGVSYSIYSHATETAARTRCTDNLLSLIHI